VPLTLIARRSLETEIYIIERIIQLATNEEKKLLFAAREICF